MLVQQSVAAAQHIPGAVVRRHDPPARVELHDAQPRGVEQIRERRARGAGPVQRLLDAQGLTDMGQETPDRVEPGGRPAVPVEGVVDDPHDARAVGSVQAHIDGIGTWCTITLAIPTLKGQLNAQSHLEMNKVPKVNLADPSVEPTDDELHALMTAVRDKVVARREAADAKFFEEMKSAIRGHTADDQHQRDPNA